MAKYDIVYMTRKVIKESVIVDHLANNAIEDYEILNFDFSDEDMLVIEKRKEIRLVDNVFWRSSKCI